jgi:hypothetical protein
MCHQAALPVQFSISSFKLPTNMHTENMYPFNYTTYAFFNQTTHMCHQAAPVVQFSISSFKLPTNMLTE